MNAAGDPDASRRLIVLGSTGSIGVSALDVVEHLEGPDALRIVGLAAGTRGERLRDQAARFSVSDVALADAAQTDVFDASTRVFTGPDAARQLVESVAQPGDLVLCAMVGAAGLPATIAAIERGCDIALANKETLVAAGELIMPLTRAHGVALYPVDSEHSAIAQCLRSGRSTSEVRRIILTASGGPFREWSRAQLEAVTPAEALDHPTWQMGPKISIDSATMMNKALEIIEAHWLFGLPASRIDALIHPQSIVHGLVEFVDGSVIAQLSPPDMRTPIQYALTATARRPGPADRMDWSTLRTLEFDQVDHDRFPAVALARDVIERGGTAGAIFNAANEAAVDAFLAGRIPFLDIARHVADALAQLPAVAADDLDVILGADADARAFVTGRIDVAARTAP